MLFDKLVHHYLQNLVIIFNHNTTVLALGLFIFIINRQRKRN